VAGYLAEIALGVNWLNPDSSSLINSGANFAPTTIGRGEYWRLLASIFLHAGIFHLALNLYALIGFGPMAESALGRWRFRLHFHFKRRGRRSVQHVSQSNHNIYRLFWGKSRHHWRPNALLLA
jgi:hypothetical protein